MLLGLFTFHRVGRTLSFPCAPYKFRKMKKEERMELINFIGAIPSQDGKWLLVTFARKGSDEKFRWIVPLEAVGKLVACKEDDRYKISLPVIKKKEEAPKEEHEPLEDEIPF